MIAGGILLSLTLAAFGTSQPQKQVVTAQGLAWEVNGSWGIAGKPVLRGDAVAPGALLQPSVTAETHSIEILLPDGQRLVYECYTTIDCARGFRVPPLYEGPDPAAVEFLSHVREVVRAHRDNEPVADQSAPPVSRLPHDESLTVLDQQNQVRIGGLASKLPNGHYTYNLRPLDPSQPRRFHLSLVKDGALITVPVPSAGIYIVTISDDLNMSRIELFVAAIKPEQNSASTIFTARPGSLWRSGMRTTYPGRLTTCSEPTLNGWCSVQKH